MSLADTAPTVYSGPMKIPNWARWLLVPAASVAGSIVAALLLMLPNYVLWLFGPFVGHIANFAFTHVASFAMAACFIAAGAYCAPSHRKAVALVLVLLAVVALVCLSILYGLATHHEHWVTFAFGIAEAFAGVLCGFAQISESVRVDELEKFFKEQACERRIAELRAMALERLQQN